MFAVASSFTLALALQSRVAYFLSGVLIAAVPLVVFGAVVVILFRVRRRERAAEASGAGVEDR